MLKKMLLGLVIVFTGATMILPLVQTYRIREGAGAELLWNEKEAYLFIAMAARGYHLSYLQYLVYVARERLGGDVAVPDHQRFSVVVLRIRPEGVQRYEIKDASLDFYTPFQGNIYANRQGTLWKWVEGHFEQANPEEKQRFESSKPELVHFTNVNGWSKAFNVLSRGDGETVFPMTLEGKALSLVAGMNIKTGEQLVGLRRPGQDPERIWYLDGRTRRVAKTEYEKAFRNP